MSKRIIREQVDRTMGLVTGVVGLGVAGGAAAGLGGTAGTIVRTGALPMAGLGLMADAAPSVSRYSRRSKTKKKRRMR